MARDNRGRSLADLMAEEGLLPLARTADLVDQIVEALRSAARRSIVVDHLEPRTILLNEGEPKGATPAATNDPSGTKHLRVTGLASAEDLSALGGADGSYLAPELKGDADRMTDERTRQFSLAAIVYEMLTGCPPFPDDEGENPSSEREGKSAPVTPVGELVVGIPAGVDGVLRRALAAQPAARFPRLEDFAVALRDILNPTAVWDDGATVIWSPEAGDMPGFEAPIQSPPSADHPSAAPGPSTPGPDPAPPALAESSTADLSRPSPAEASEGLTTRAPPPPAVTVNETPTPAPLLAPALSRTAAAADPFEATPAPDFDRAPWMASGKPSKRTQLSFLAAAVVLLIAAVTVMSGSRKTTSTEKAITESTLGPSGPTVRALRPKGATTSSLAATPADPPPTLTLPESLPNRGRSAGGQSHRNASHRPGSSSSHR